MENRSPPPDGIARAGVRPHLRPIWPAVAADSNRRMRTRKHGDVAGAAGDRRPNADHCQITLGTRLAMNVVRRQIAADLLHTPAGKVKQS